MTSVTVRVKLKYCVNSEENKNKKIKFSWIRLGLVRLGFVGFSQIIFKT